MGKRVKVKISFEEIKDEGEKGNFPPSAVEFTGHIYFLDAIKEMLETHTKKNQGYAGKNVDNPLQNFYKVNEYFPETSVTQGFLTRLTDKWERLRNIYNDGENPLEDESWIDTITDMANYLMLLRAYLLDSDNNIKYENKVIIKGIPRE